MGILDFFSKSAASEPLRLPSGSFSVDRQGKILTSTLPGAFPKEHVEELARCVLEALQSAQNAQVAVSEMVVRYGSYKITAKEMRGGALIFLVPQSPISV